MMALNHLTSLLPADHAESAKQGLRLIMPLLVAAGMTSIPSPVKPERFSDMSLNSGKDPYGSPVLFATPSPRPTVASPSLRADGRGRSPRLTREQPHDTKARSHSPVRRRQLSKTCMPVGFPVHVRVSGETKFEDFRGSQPASVT